MIIGGLYDMFTNSPTNLELLKLATELAYSDYNNRRANIHNQWLADNEKMQKLYRTSVPYPSIPPYPTEEDIISKAHKLIEFLNATRPDLDKPELRKEVVEVEVDTDVKQEVGRDIEVEKQDYTSQNIPNEKLTTDKTSVIDRIKKTWR